MMVRSMRGAVAMLVMTMAPGGALLAQGPGYPALSEEEELRLALSAGPLSVTEAADVYRMGDDGFERVIEGSNGFACLVVRSAGAKDVLAPHCLNPAAVATVLPAFLAEAELQVSGMDGAAITSELMSRWESGRLPLPEGPAYAYMLSSGQRLGATAGSFKPHFMLYVPYVTNADIGGDPRRQEFPFVGPIENHPLSTVVIIMEEFVDPMSVLFPVRR